LDACAVFTAFTAAKCRLVARALCRRGRDRSVIARSHFMRTIILAFAALIAAAGCATAQQTPPSPTCAAPEHRAFDFWIGEWDAYVTGTENLAGRSSIKSEDSGCVITEHWTSVQTGTFTGRSLNLYDRASGHWEQFWVDSTGELTHFVGGPIADGMRLVDAANITATQATPQHTRMTFTANPDGSVRQFGESSPDGQTWTADYDFTYRRRAG
jgi:hypothetical protein